MASVALMRTPVRLRGTSFLETPAASLPEQRLRQVDRPWTSGATLTATDPLIASYIRGQHFLAAMQLGEPYRVSLALVLEAVQASMPRFARYSRSREVLAMASRIAERLDIPHAKAMARLGAAGVAFFWGRMQEALHAGLDADEILRAECRGVSLARHARAPRLRSTPPIATSAC
jgi:hypothetical protein